MSEPSHSFTCQSLLQCSNKDVMGGWCASGNIFLADKKSEINKIADPEKGSEISMVVDP